MGLAHLAMPEEGSALEWCQEVRQVVNGSVAEECQATAGITANHVMQERRGMLASRIGEAVAVETEEKENQMEVLRSTGNAFLNNMRGTASASEILHEEAPTVHYLYYSLVLMECVLTERERERR